MEDTTRDKSQVKRHEAEATSPASDVVPSILPRLVAGSIGSIVTALAVTPLEVVKVRQQMSSPSSSTLPTNVMPCPNGCGTFVLNNGIMDCVLPRSCVPFFDQHGRYRDFISNNNTASVKKTNNIGTFGMLRRIFLQEGFTGIYAGLAPTLVMSVPNTVLYFTSYDEIVSRLRRRLDSEASWIPLVSGASARMLASTVTAPLELIRTRQASLIGQSQAAPGMWAEFRIIVRGEGARALFTGLGPTLWRDVPFSAIYWYSLEQFKLIWKQRDGDVAPSPTRTAGQAFLNGAAAGMIASCATTPFDVVKTRRQQADLVSNSTESAQQVVCHHNGAAVYDPPSACSPRSQTRTAATMKQIIETEGITGLWRGNQTRMIKVAPACAIMISCYELGKRMME